MQVYNLEVRTPSHVSMRETGPFPSDNAVQAHASKRIGQMLISYSEQMWTDQEWKLDVADQDGKLLWVMTLAIA